MNQPKDSKFSEEINQMECEPMLPAEKKLILWSLVLGVGLLVVLYQASHIFFPAGH